MRLYDYPEKVAAWERKINAYAQQKVEFGVDAGLVAEKVAEIEAVIAQKVAELDALPSDAALANAEPDDLPTILSLRPAGQRRQWTALARRFPRAPRGGLGWGAAPAAPSARLSKAGRSSAWKNGLTISAMNTRSLIIGASPSSPT